MANLDPNTIDPIDIDQIITLPTGLITLQNAQTSADASSHILVHNTNMSEIQLWLRSFKVALQFLLDNSGSSLDLAIVANMIQTAKTNIILPINMTNGQEIIDSNGYSIKRLGVPVNGSPNAVEYYITDTNTARNTIFSKTLVTVKQYDGTIVYPSLTQNLTNLRIVFNQFAETAATPAHTDATTDPNIKIITIF